MVLQSRQIAARNSGGFFQRSQCDALRFSHRNHHPAIAVMEFEWQPTGQQFEENDALGINTDCLSRTAVLSSPRQAMKSWRNPVFLTLAQDLFRSESHLVGWFSIY